VFAVHCLVACDMQVILPCYGCPPDVFVAIELSPQPPQHGDLRTFYNNRCIGVLTLQQQVYCSAHLATSLNICAAGLMHCLQALSLSTAFQLGFHLNSSGR
jgi:hypothetical protein